MDLPIDSLILEQAPVLVLNTDNTIEKWNKGLSQLYGWRQDEALGKNVDQLLMTVFPQPRDEIDRQFLEKGEWQGKLLQTRKDASRVTVLSRWVLIKNEQGNFSAILEFISEVSEQRGVKTGFKETEYKRIIDDASTERKRAVEALREAERFTQATLDALPHNICVLDENGTIISINRAWREFADANGATDPSHYLGVNYLDVCDGALGKNSAEAGPTAEGIRKVMRHEIDQFSIEYTCDSPWENRWFIANVSRFKGEVLDRVIVYHVINTAHKQSELHLAQLTKQYQVFIENSGTGIVVLDENGKYILVNSKAAENLGKSPDEIVGKSMFDLLPREIAQKYLELNQRLLDRGGLREYEDTFALPGGEKTFLIVDHCIQDENHKNFAIQSSSIDITERKKAEEGLRESRERLSRLSYHLVQTQEQERHRIARELHDEIGQTLTALTIALNGISQTDLDKSLSQKFENLRVLARDLIDQVNTLSSDLRPRVLDDLGLVPGLISMINRLATQTGIEIDFNHGPLDQKKIPSEVELTAYRIIQEALTNVIRHANVNLANVRMQIDAETLWIQIQDAGNGFDYHSALNSGDSIGLMSMLERAEQVGGLFEIQTAPGEGTNITVRLPLSGVFIERRKYGRD